MSLTSLKTLVAVVVAVGYIGIAHQASALLFQDANYIGHIDDGIPANETAEVGYINNLITLAAGQGDTTIGTETYNREGSIINCGTLPCPTAVLAGNSGNIDDGTGQDIDVTGFTYLLGKYDGPNEGSVVWYVGDLSGDQDIPSSCCGTTTFGLSHYVLFNPGEPDVPVVPEPATLLLLGSGLVGIVAWGRRSRRG